MKVLDLDCGTGDLSKVLAEHVGLGGKVIAMDPDKERLRIAKETYSAVSNILFQEGSTYMISLLTMCTILCIPIT